MPSWWERACRAAESRTLRLTLLAIVGFALLGGAALRSITLASTGVPPSSHVPGLVIADLARGERLLQHLRGGVFVLLVRHFEAPVEGAPPDCATRGGSSAEGRRNSDLGGALVRLGVPVGRVLSSRRCGSRQAARLMFGREPDAVAEDVFPGLLGRRPGPGRNTVVLVDSPLLGPLGPIAEGETYVFQPLGRGRFNLVARVKDGEWQHAVAAPVALGGGAVEEATDRRRRAQR